MRSPIPQSLKKYLMIGDCGLQSPDRISESGVPEYNVPARSDMPYQTDIRVTATSPPKQV